MIAGQIEIQLLADIARLQRDMNRANQVVDRATSGMARAAEMAKAALAGIAGGFSLGAIVSQLVGAQREFDKLNASLITATGSAAGASAAYKSLQTFAATTPYSVAEATEAFIKMKNLGLDPSERALRAYGNTASSMGKDLDQMIEAVADAASGEFERLKEFGIKASQENGRVALTFRGVTTSIGNNATEIQAYLKKIGEVDFAGAMERRAATLDGAISNLGDSWNTFVLNFAQSGFGDAAQDGVRKMASLLDRLGEKVDALADGMVAGAKIGAAYVGAFVLAPVIFQGAATWLGNLNLQIALARMEMARGTPITTLFAGSINGVGVSALWASGMLGKLKIATASLFALYAGWEIGKYLEEQFVEVKIFAEVLTGAVLEMWEHIKLGSKLALDAMTVMWRATFSGLTASLAPVYETIAAGLRKMGFGEKAGQIQDFADRVRAAGESQGTFASRTAEARSEHERNIKAIRQVTDSHVAAIIVADQVSEATRGVAVAATAAGTAVSEMSKEEKKALQDAKDFIEGQKRELEAIGKTQSQQRMLTAARAAAAAPTAALRREIMSLADAIEAETKAWDDAEAARKAVEDAVGANAETMLQLHERARGLEREIELHGKTAEAAIMAGAAKVRASAEAGVWADDYRAKLIAQADELERIAKLQGKKDAQEASSKAAQQAADDWKRASEEINRSLTDALLRGFESGKSFGRNLVDTLKNMFSTLVLRPVIQGIMAPVTGALVGGVPGAAQAAGGGAGVGTAVSGLGTLGALGSGAGLLGAGGLGLQAGFGALMSGGVAGVGAAVSGGIAAIGAGTGASIAAGLGTIAGALGPIALGIGAAAALFKGAFGMKDKKYADTSSLVGSIADGGFAGTVNTAWTQKGGWFRSDKSDVDRAPVNAEMAKSLGAGYEAIKAASADFARTLGINADFIKDRAQAVNIALGKDDAANQKAIADFFVGVGNTIAGELLPSLSQFQQEGEQASATLQRLATGYALIDTALTSIGMAFNAVGVQSLEARERLLAAAGGLEAFAANTAGFQQNFLTEVERNAPVLAMVTEQLAALGLSAIDTREEFKQAVLGLDLTTEAGAKQYGALMKLQAAFAQVYPAIDHAAAAAAVLQQRTTLQDEYDQLTMTSAQLLARQRDALDESNRALFDQIQAIKAQAAATQAVKDRGSNLLSGVDSMFSALQSVVGREKALLQEVTGKHQALAQALRGTLDSMSVAGRELEDRQGARAQIQAALAIAKAGGVLPDADSLKGALSILSKDASSMFATQQDYLRDFYSTQNDIAALAGLTDDALSVEEQSLKALDGILDSAQQQINALKGIDTSVLTLAQAISGFDRALGAAKADPVASAGGSIADLYRELLGRPADSAGLDYWQNAVAGGLSLDQVRKMIMEGAEYKGLRGFAVGTNYVPTNMPAMIHEGERIIPAADNRELMRRLSSPSEGNAALVAEIKALRETVAKQQTALDKIVNNTGEHKEMFDKATGGGGPMLVEIEK